MKLRPFHILTKWDLDPDTRAQITNLDWTRLPITTAFSRAPVLYRILQGWVQGSWSPRSFFRSYGMWLQSVVTLLNLRVPDSLEQQIQHDLSGVFGSDREPVIRMQVIYHGNCVPTHVDATREVSLVIPVHNHAGSYTQFFQSSQPWQDLADPTRCELSDQVEITAPTLIDTKVPHGVRCCRSLSRQAPRISITAKWCDVSYTDLVRSL